MFKRRGTIHRCRSHTQLEVSFTRGSPPLRTGSSYLSTGLCTCERDLAHMNGTSHLWIGIAPLNGISTCEPDFDSEWDLHVWTAVHRCTSHSQVYTCTHLSKVHTLFTFAYPVHMCIPVHTANQTHMCEHCSYLHRDLAAFRYDFGCQTTLLRQAEDFILISDSSLFYWRFGQISLWKSLKC